MPPIVCSIKFRSLLSLEDGVIQCGADALELPVRGRQLCGLICQANANAVQTNHNATILVATTGANMPTSLTLKNIPDAVYERLKAAAELHRRSLNSEAIVCLESVLLPSRVTPSERLARARELRASLLPGQFTANDIDAAKKAGRK